MPLPAMATIGATPVEQRSRPAVSTGEASTEEPEVLVEQRDRPLIITINRPRAKNAVSPALANALAEAVDRLDGDANLSVGILTGAGGSFCAGMDLKAF